MSAGPYIEGCLMRQRGWSIRHPKQEDVVLLLTGGMDSSVLAELCICRLGSTVYPLYIRRGARSEQYEEQAAEAVVDYLQKKYPEKIKNLYVIDAEIPPSNVKAEYNIPYIRRVGYPLRNTILELYAVQYAAMLGQNGVPVYSIVVGSIDGDTSADGTAISFLAATLTVCVHLDDWRWQIVAPYLLKNLLPNTAKIRKKDIIKWGREQHFPFQLTRSCMSADARECSTCVACTRRKKLLQQE